MIFASLLLLELICSLLVLKDLHLLLESLFEDHWVVLVSEGVIVLLHRHRNLLSNCFDHCALPDLVPLLEILRCVIQTCLAVRLLDILRKPQAIDNLTLHVLREESYLLFLENEHFDFGCDSYNTHL